MVILELDQRYPDRSDLDRTWQAGASAFTAASSAASGGGPNRGAGKQPVRRAGLSPGASAQAGSPGAG